MNELKKVTLSYSSSKTIKSCEFKYYAYKVANLPLDEDYEEGTALGFGKAFHKVLETTLHESFSDTLILRAMEEFGVDPKERALLTAMLDNYVRVHRMSGLKVVQCELPLQTDKFIGFIDFIAQASNGWWIGDNKTAGRHDPSLVQRLHKDPQVNLYSYFAGGIESLLKLKGPFLGFRYRQSIKSKSTTPTGLFRGTPTFDIEIPAALLNPQEAWDNHMAAHERAEEILNGSAPSRNFGACFDYYRPCQYYSKCHGHLSTKGNGAIVVHTLESLQDASLL